MFDVIVDIDEAIAQELSDWCDFNLDGFMGYVTHGTGYKFYFDTLKEARAFKSIMQNEEWN